MSEREEEEEEEDDSMEGFMHTPIRVAYALLPDTFPSSMDIFRHWGGRVKYWTRDGGKFTVRLAFIVRFDRWRAVPDIHRIPSVSILLSFLCPPGYL